MKPTEIRQMTDTEIGERLEASYKELFNLRFRLSTRQLTNTSEIPKVKKDIARLKTAVRERELSKEMPGQMDEGSR